MATLKVTFKKEKEFDKNGKEIKVDVHIGFLPQPKAPETIISKIKDGSTIQALDAGGGIGNWYSLDTLESGVNITSFHGRVYVCYGTPWSIQNAGYEPGQSVTDPNFYLRYDKMELDFTGEQADCADITSIDYWSIPISLTTMKKGSPVDTRSCFLNDNDAQSIYKELKALTAPPVSGVVGPGGLDGQPLCAAVPGDFVKFPNGPSYRALVLSTDLL